MITNFKDKKLVEYLEDGKRYLIRFGHGLGDTLMFMPLFYKLKELYPASEINIYIENGQEEIFRSSYEPDKDSKDYDEVFSLDFPMSEGTGITKWEKCWVDEIGLSASLLPAEYIIWPWNGQSSKFVAVHFQGTALPNSVNCDEAVAKKIWNEIKRAGFIPIEVHFEHTWHNPVNKKYSFINRDVRDIEPSVQKLRDVIRNCFAFIGVASGPFMIAMKTMPEQILYLQKHHKLECYTKLDVDKINIEPEYYEDDVVYYWLKKRKLWKQSLQS